MQFSLAVPLLVLAISTPAYAWDGEDEETGVAVEIEKGNLVRRGLEIEIYDSSDDSYHNATVESIRGLDTHVELEVYDHDTGESRTFNMEKD